MTKRRLFRDPERWWWLLPVLATLVALAQGFSNSRVFYIRDLSQQYLQEHRWLRASLFEGSFPLWDPYSAFGQPAIADPARQMLFPVTLLLRFLPETIGFNLICLLPYPTAAIGTYLFLRRHVSRRSAALGASVFAVSGPMLSTGNFPNFSWVCCFIPFALWSLDRSVALRTLRSAIPLAVVFCFQVLAGEAVALGATASLVVFYAVFGCPLHDHSLRARLDAAIRALGAGVCGAALSAVQLAPLLAAAAESPRSGHIPASIQNAWSLHPLFLVETVVPGLFGNYYQQGATPWLLALNTHREPLLFSLYFGFGAIALAVLGAGSFQSRRTRRFWLICVLSILILAMGSNTPVLDFLKWICPPFRAVRFPSKLLVFFAFGVAVLAAFGWETLDQRSDDQTGRRTWRAMYIGFGGAGSLLVLTLCLSLAAPDLVAYFLERLAGVVGIPDASTAAHMLIDSILECGPRALVVAIGIAMLLTLGNSQRPESRLAKTCLFVALVFEPAITNRSVNPTIEVENLEVPAWTSFVQAHPEDRVYFGPRTRLAVLGAPDIDDPFPGQVDAHAEYTYAENLAIQSGIHAIFPGGAGLREPISHDFTVLWPLATHRFQGLFALSERETRLRVLHNVGTRYFALPRPGPGDFIELTQIPDGRGLSLYEGGPPTPRAILVQNVECIPDRDGQIRRLFDPNFNPRERILLDHPAHEAPGEKASLPTDLTQIVTDLPNEVHIQANVPAPGSYLLLQDAFNQGWRAEVDGTPVDVFRADGVFRAVWLTEGAHYVVFRFEPIDVVLGLAISGIAALGLTGIAVFPVLLHKRPKIRRRLQ